MTVPWFKSLRLIKRPILNDVLFNLDYSDVSRSCLYASMSMSCSSPHLSCVFEHTQSHFWHCLPKKKVWMFLASSLRSSSGRLAHRSYSVRVMAHLARPSCESSWPSSQVISLPSQKVCIGSGKRRVLGMISGKVCLRGG